MDLQTELASRGGAARMGTLSKAGVTPRQIRSALREGHVRREAHGVVALPDASQSGVLAATIGAAHTCVTALAHHGIPLPRLEPIPHLAVPHAFTSHGRDLSAVRLHYVKGSVLGGSTVPIVDALDTAGACLSDVWQVVAVDAALNRGLITMADVAGFTRTRRERRDFLLAHADSRSEAAGETIARLLIAQAGLQVHPQAYVPGVGRVDLVVDGLVVVEVDGYAHHDDAASFRRDRERDRVTVKAGRPTLRYASSELTGAWKPDLVADVRGVVAGWEALSRGRPQ